MNDEQWVIRALQSPDDFLCLVIKYEPVLKRYIQRISGVSTEESQDITQEVFLKVYRHLNDFDPRLKFSSWIYRIAHNHTINQVTKNRKLVFSPEEDLSSLLSQEIFADDALEQSDSKSLMQNQLSDCLQSLNDNQKAVVRLYFWEEKSYEEISDILHLPLGTVGTHMNRGKQKIKDCLRKHL